MTYLFLHLRTHSKRSLRSLEKYFLGSEIRSCSLRNLSYARSTAQNQSSQVHKKAVLFSCNHHNPFLIPTQPHAGFHCGNVNYNVVPFNLSDIGEGIKEVTIKEWFIKVGDKVAQFDQICEVQSDKASVTITSRFDGIVKKIYYEVDDIALVGTPLVDIELEESATNVPVDQMRVVQEGDAIQVGRSEDSLRLPSQPSHVEKTLATPAVRRIASENKVDLKDVAGTGKEGRVLKEDIINYVNAKTSKASSSSASPIPKPTPSQDKTAVSETAIIKSLPVHEPLADRKEQVKGYTRAMIKTMTIANNIPHFGYCDEIDVSQLSI